MEDNIKFDEKMINSESTVDVLKDVLVMRHYNKVKETITNANIGIGRNTLSAHEASSIRQIVSSIMQKLGYLP